MCDFLGKGNVKDFVTTMAEEIALMIRGTSSLITLMLLPSKNG